MGAHCGMELRWHRLELGSSLDREIQGLFYPPPHYLPLLKDVSSLTHIRCASRNVSEPLKGNRQTNQRAELTAILRALDIAPRHRDVTIVTDSRYAIDCVTVWYKNWQRNNWMTKDGKPVENKDLVESVLVNIEERVQLKVKTLFEWVKGHAKDPGNEAADRLAVNGAHRGVAEKAEALEASRDLPDELLEEDF